MMNERTKRELRFAKEVGFISSDNLPYLKNLFEKENLRRKQNSFGPSFLSFDEFIETLLTDFFLAFILRKESIKYCYDELTEKDYLSYWNSKRNLFTRYSGDCFDYEESKDIIAKRIREEEYEKNVERILL